VEFFRKRNKQYWFHLAFQLRGSVLPAIYLRVTLVGIFGLIISALYYFKYPVSQPILGSIIPSIVLGLLLVFRTNTAYERFWEGRRLWGNLVNDSRNMALQIWVMMNDVEPEDRAKRIAVLRLVIAFTVATKLYLRSEPVNRELKPLMSLSQYLQLKTISNPLN
jgi:ion channel-forming bestrophin family protein